MASTDRFDSLARYGSIDKTQWVLANCAPLTASGQNEVLAQFEFKSDAEDWARLKFVPRWRREYAVGKRAT